MQAAISASITRSRFVTQIDVNLNGFTETLKREQESLLGTTTSLGELGAQQAKSALNIDLQKRFLVKKLEKGGDFIVRF